MRGHSTCTARSLQTFSCLFQGLRVDLPSLFPTTTSIRLAVLRLRFLRTRPTAQLEQSFVSRGLADSGSSTVFAHKTVFCLTKTCVVHISRLSLVSYLLWQSKCRHFAEHTDTGWAHRFPHLEQQFWQLSIGSNTFPTSLTERSREDVSSKNRYPLAPRTAVPPSPEAHLCVQPFAYYALPLVSEGRSVWLASVRQEFD